MNGYFQLICEENCTKLRIIPPRDGGEMFTMNEVMGYLQQKNITYDLSALNNAVSTAEKPLVVKLEDKQSVVERESYKVAVSPDNMEATVRFYAPAQGGELLNKEEFMSDLPRMKVRYGILEEEIDRFFSERQYCTTYKLAQGKPPVHGKDASIEYFFNTDLRIKPTMKEDGSVDFFNLNTISHCNKGDLLARLTPADPGEYGTDIRGERIKPRDVKRDTLKFGRNISLSEDGTEIHSDVNGHVTYVEGKVFVSDVFEVENVDNSTGNIEYEGSVQINGNVGENFSVKAKGNVEVKGVVEGAHIEAGGNIIIARGMNGMGKGTLKAEGNIVSKFLENANVIAGGYVTTESILHSTVMAKTEVTVSGKRGFITGGRVSAGNTISVKTLGSSMGADTLVEVGTDPSVKLRLLELQKEIGEVVKVLKSVQPLIDAGNQKLAKGKKLDPEQLKYLLSLVKLRDAKKLELEKDNEELAVIQEEFGNMKNGQIIVSGVIFPGTKVCIADASMVIKSSVKYCRLIKEGGDVKVTAY